MTLTRTHMSRSIRSLVRLRRVAHVLLLIPEAPLLVVLIFLAWLFRFPPLVGVVVVAVALWFVVRSVALLLAEQRWAHGDERRAAVLAHAALRMHPWSLDALLLRFHIDMQCGCPKEAGELLGRAVRLDEQRGDVQAARAAYLLAQGGTPAPAPRTAPGSVSPALLHHYARVALHVEHNPAKACDLLQQIAVDRLPASSSTPLLLLLAEAYWAQDRFAEAGATLQRAEAQLARCARVQRAEALYQLGCLWQKLGRDSTVYFRHSVELDSKGRYAHAAWRSAVTGK